MSKLDEILKKLCEHAASEGGNGDLVFTALDYGRPKKQVKDLFKELIAESVNTYDLSNPAAAALKQKVDSL